jgi:hypothetical protein
MSDRLISIIIPCYNGSAFLDTCVRSAAAQGVESEIIIIDDGSTDDSAERARHLVQSHTGAVLICQANQGPAAARNAGIRAASGKYLCFLDVDDELAAGALFAAIELLEQDRAAVAVQGRLELVNLHRPVQEWQRESMEATIPGTIVLRTEAARQLGGFPVDPALRGKTGGEDGCFRLQLARCGKVLKLDRPFLKYRIRPASHADYFLERSIWQDGRIEFTEQSPQERDGTLFAAFNRYAEQVCRRQLSRAAEALHGEITAVWEYDRWRRQLEQLAGSVEPLEGFALYAFAKRWMLDGSAVSIGTPDARAIGWLAAGCKAAARGRVIAVAQTEHDAALEQLRRSGEPGDVIDVRSGDAMEIARTWTVPIRVLFINPGESFDQLTGQAAAWTQHLLPHGLLALCGNLQDPAITALFEQLRNDIAHWKGILTLQRLAVLEKVSDSSQIS